MAKNASKNLSLKHYTDDIWQDSLAKGMCPYGCVVKTKICKHLEAQLPKYSGKSVSAKLIAFIEVLEDKVPFAGGYEDELDQFLNSIADFDLTTDQVRILVGRCVYSYTFAKIAKLYKISSAGFAHKLYKQAIETLKKGNYGGE